MNKKTPNNHLRLKSDNNGKSNVLQRVSLNFKKFCDSINKIRDINGFDELSCPKISELLVTHKKYSKLIKADIVNYNISLDDEVGFND